VSSCSVFVSLRARKYRTLRENLSTYDSYSLHYLGCVIRESIGL
jgi:hypothetical protein